MDHSHHSDSLTLKQRLCCLLAASESEAEALLRAGTAGADTSAMARRVGLNTAEVNHIVSSRRNIENARIDINHVRQLQLFQILNLSPNRYQAIMDGRPFFSLAEFEEASGLSRLRVADLFSAPGLVSIDKMTGRRRSLEPVYGRYIALPRLEFETSGHVEALGFIEHPVSATAQIRLIQFSETETNQKVFKLKQALGGNIFPVVHDSEGFERYFVPASIDVWFRQEISEQRALAIVNELRLRVKLHRSSVGYYQVELLFYPQNLHVMAATLDKIDQIHTYTEVAFAEQTEVGFEDFLPVNERQLLDFEDSSAGPRTWNLDLIDAQGAHELTTGSADVTVLIVDSGIRPDHQDLISALRPDWNTLDLNYDLGVPEQVRSPTERSVAHGTKVASIAIGRGPANGSRVRGVAPGCWLLPVKISGSPFGQSYGLRAAAIREAIDYLSTDQRGVLNISWSTNGEHIGIREALFAAYEKGFAIATSAGNYHPNEPQIPDKPHYPSAYAFLPGHTEVDVIARSCIPGLASVAAVDAMGKKASYSYYGANTVTVSAPGGEPGNSGRGVFVASTPADYAYDSGTSFAAPHVAGLVALLLSAKPELTAQAAIDVIRSTATDLNTGNPNFIGMLGSGLINARAALNSVNPTEAVSAEPDSMPVIAPDGPQKTRMNVNIATRQQFEALPYIGQWSADIIINHRNLHGPFAEIWDLALTGAVDRWTIDQIKHLITIDLASTEGMLTIASSDPSAENSQNILNINMATAAQFAALPLIGDWSAARLVQHRIRHGPYRTLEDMALPGVIDYWTINEIRDLVAVV